MPGGNATPPPSAKIVFRPLVIFGAGDEPMCGDSLRAAAALRTPSVRVTRPPARLVRHREPRALRRAIESAG